MYYGKSVQLPFSQLIAEKTYDTLENKFVYDDGLSVIQYKNIWIIHEIICLESL